MRSWSSQWAIKTLDPAASDTVLPLALVNPPQGVKVLASCIARLDLRPFFVRSLQGPTPQPGDFTGERMTLLEGLLDKYGGRA